MKKLILVICYFVPFLCVSQVKVNPVVGISESTSFDIPFWGNYLGHAFLSTNIKLGVQLEMKSGRVLQFNPVYQFSGMQISDAIFGKTYSLHEHAIGGNITYYFSKADRRFNAFIQLSGLSVISSNLHYITRASEDSFYFGTTPNYYYDYDHYTYERWKVYYSNFYKGTPFIGSLLAGCSFSINKQLKLNLSAGYGCRIIKITMQEFSWKNSKIKAELESKAKHSPIRRYYFSMWNIELGINYSFPFQKRSKTE